MTYKQKYYAKNKEKLRAERRAYYKKHQKTEIVKKIAWAKANPSKIKATAKRYHEKIRNTVLQHYGNVCACCQESRREFLAIDHVNGGGTQMRKVHGTAAQFLKYVIDHGFPLDFRILCHNCNHSRGCYGYCPHERET